MDKLNLLLLTGGNSLEHDISLKSCENVYEHIDKNKYNIKTIILPKNFNKNLKWLKEILSFNPDIVFNTIHGAYGEDGLLQGFLDTLSIKYIGSKCLSSALCMDKKLTKDILKFNKIPVLDDILLKKNEDFFSFKTSLKELGFPLILKPNSCGSSIGVHLANNMEEVKDSISKIKSIINCDILIEKYIKGQEITCCIMQKNDKLEIFPILDIKPKDSIFSFEQKYNKNTDISFSTLPNFIKTMINEISKKIFVILKCRGFVNIDFIVKEEEAYFLEINTLPGLTKDSLFLKALKTMDIDFSDFLDNLIQFSINYKEDC